MADSRAKVEEWYRDHAGALLRSLGGGFGDGADDLLRGAVVHALRRPQKVGAATWPRAWLFGIARHVGLSAFRKRRKTSALPEEVAARADETEPRLVDMREAIGKLPEEMRETLELRLADDLSYEEIAAVRSEEHTSEL